MKTLDVENLDYCCKTCGLYKTCRTYQVPSERLDDGADGPVDVLFVGETPGDEDDMEGVTCAGPAGYFLRKIVEPMKVTKAFTYAVKCRPPLRGNGENKTYAPTREEILACQDFFSQDLLRFKPRVIVCLGNTALKAVLGAKSRNVTQMKGVPTKVGDTWVVAAYHPSNHTSGRMNLLEDYFGLMTLIDQLLSGAYQQFKYDITVVDANNYKQAFREIVAQPMASIDVETDTISSKAAPDKQTFYMRGRRLLCLGVTPMNETRIVGTTWVFPVQYVTQDLVDALRRKTLLGHNIKYDLSVLAWFLKRPDIWEADIEDAFLMHTSYDQGYIGNGLDNLCMKYLQIPNWKGSGWDHVEAETDRRRDLPKGDPLKGVPATLGDIAFNDLAVYNGQDCINEARLWLALTHLRPAPDVYHDLLLKFVPLLGEVETRGIPIDEKRLQLVKAAYLRKYDTLLATLRELPEIKQVEEALGQPFNPRSPLQLTHLYKVMDIVVTETTATGSPSTRKEILGKIAEENSLWRRLKACRDLLNTVSKFLEPLSYHVARDERVHTSYSIGKTSASVTFGADPSGGTATGRLSSANPALHNLKKDKVLRILFKAPEGKMLVESDYSHMEVRGIAVLAQCKRLLEIFGEGRDPYVDTVSRLWGHKYAVIENRIAEGDKKFKQLRSLAKTGFLAKLYRIGLSSFAARNGISLEEAKKFFVMFDKTFPEIGEFQDKVLKLVADGQPVVTPFGRSRIFSYTGDSKQDSHTANAAVNYPVQSTCSDLTLTAALMVRRSVPPTKCGIVNIVHDSLWLEVPLDELNEIVYTVEGIMTTPELPFTFNCPLKVATTWGPNLGATM